ncbi:MAG TPA: hypothetical protein VMT17_08500 [Anaeromyxobacteraceae bacterium]|nr:hypothetical protein [Anaeromyxobacteraceae bacterium]
MPPLRLADLVHAPVHAGPLDGADAFGEASGGDRLVQVGLWIDAGGGVQRARHRATSCAALIGYAEAACRLAEAGEPLEAIDGGRLQAAVSGAHPLHGDRAGLVALALERARLARPASPEAP